MPKFENGLEAYAWDMYCKDEAGNLYEKAGVDCWHELPEPLQRYYLKLAEQKFLDN